MKILTSFGGQAGHLGSQGTDVVVGPVVGVVVGMVVVSVVVGTVVVSVVVGTVVVGVVVPTSISIKMLVKLVKLFSNE
jgi:hypothetical protein